MKARDKVFKLNAMAGWCHEKRSQGRTIVFTNGCFDLLHIGHLRYLEAAGELGDFLVVGINTDRSVREIKGEGRPIVPESERSELIAALHCVHGVVLFDTPDPLPLILRLKPDVLVKGADWPLDRIVGADEVISDGGMVERIPLVSGRSTTDILERIRVMASQKRG